MTTTTVFEIPLRPSLPVEFTMWLGQVHCNLRLIWTDVGAFPDDDPGVEEGGWLLDVNDDNDSPLACGIPLVTGEDIFAQYPDLGLPPTWVTTPGNPFATPTYSNIGVDSHVYFSVTV